MERLKSSTRGACDNRVSLPGYDRDTLKAGIVHLGIGAFHRAHQAVYTEDAIEHSGGNWGITGVSLRSNKVYQQLSPQDCLYSVLSEDGRQNELRIIGAVLNVLVAPENPGAVCDAIASASTHLLTLTITEKGYCLAADGRALDKRDPGIAHDLANPLQPVSVIGLLSLGLQQRANACAAPLTIISCDNLAENSRVLKGVVTDYLRTCFPGVLPWLEQSVRFPCSMVDRIVPAATTHQLDRQSQLLGLDDEAAVSTEPFRQWVIEDNFATERPNWESAGVQLVADILPYENMKLQLLNAAHSAIAYCGLLAGLQQVDQVMKDTIIGPYIEQLMSRELEAVLEVPDGFDPGAYRTALIERFRNPCLKHQCRQIAMDGSEKIAQRWLPALQKRPSPLLVRALAAWAYFVLFTEQDIDDPRRNQLLEQRESAEPLHQRTRAVLACARMTPESIADFDDLDATLQQHLDTMQREGVLALLAA